MAVKAVGRQEKPPPLQLDGFLNIDKPPRWTSHDVVAKLRRSLRIPRIGHTGTLDPMATGVLLLCVGRATKVARFLLKLDKEYLATMTLGGESDTLDAQGHISRSEECPEVSPQQLQDVFSRFTGTQQQIPPMFSAVKHRGRPLYRLARRGKTVVRRPRLVTIRSLQLCRYEAPHVTFRVSCSSGTYIRVLAADMGRELGCGAYLAQLCRTRLGPFALQEALSLPQAVELAETGHLGDALTAMSRGLRTYPRLVAPEGAVPRILQGQPMIKGLFRELPVDARKGDEVRIEDQRGRVLAMAQLLIDVHQISELSPADRVCKPLRILS